MDGTGFDTARHLLQIAEQQTQEQLALLDERAREAQTPDEVAFSSDAALADESPLTVEREKESTLRRALQRRLVDVQSALGKLDQGTYGRCDACGQEINPKRLRAQPQAALCLSCQAQAERSRA